MDLDQWRVSNFVKFLVMKPEIIKEIVSTTFIRYKLFTQRVLGDIYSSVIFH